MLAESSLRSYENVTSGFRWINVMFGWADKKAFKLGSNKRIKVLQNQSTF